MILSSAQDAAPAPALRIAKQVLTAAREGTLATEFPVPNLT